MHPRGHAASLAEAFQARLGEEATLAAHDVLSLARRAAALVPGLDLADAEEDLLARINSLRAACRAETERLASQLAMLWHLASDDRDLISSAMHRLSLIETALHAPLSEDADEAMIPALNGLRSPLVPPDFPELRRVLAQVKSLVDRRHDHITAE